MIRSRVAGLVSGALFIVLAAATTAACTAQPTAGRPAGDTLPTAASSAPSAPSTTIAPPPPTTLTTTAPAPATSPAPAAPPATAVPAPARTTGMPECTVGMLSLRLGPANSGAGHLFQELAFTNKSRSSCFIIGFPGVSLVDFHGHQVGQPAVRDGAKGGTITLAPGQVASSDVALADPGVFDPSACKPVQVAGLRVYPPDSFAAMFVSDPRTACSGPIPESQLMVQTMVRGTGV